jgi:hypothetical protein
MNQVNEAKSLSVDPQVPSWNVVQKMMHDLSSCGTLSHFLLSSLINFVYQRKVGDRLADGRWYQKSICVIKESSCLTIHRRRPGAEMGS